MNRFKELLAQVENPKQAALDELQAAGYNTVSIKDPIATRNLMLAEGIHGGRFLPPALITNDWILENSRLAQALGLPESLRKPITRISLPDVQDRIEEDKQLQRIADRLQPKIT